MTLNELIEQLTHQKQIFEAANFEVLIDPEGENSHPHPTVQFSSDGKGTVWI